LGLVEVKEILHAKMNNICHHLLTPMLLQNISRKVLVHTMEANVVWFCRRKRCVQV